MPVAEVVENQSVLRDFYVTEGAHFTGFKIVDGLFEGTLDDGRVVEVEEIHRRGDGETRITYYEEGEARLAVRRPAPPVKRRRY